MNQAQREAKIMQAVGAVAAATGKEVDEFGMSIYVEDLGRFEGEEFARILTRLRQAFRERTLPSVKELEDAALQRASGKNDVDEAVARICTAIRTCGTPNMSRAMEFIGELGWSIVQRYGGWAAVCAVESEKDLAVMRAQMKQTGESVRERASLGVLNEAPRLPAPAHQPALKPASALLAGVLDAVRR